MTDTRAPPTWGPTWKRYGSASLAASAEAVPACEASSEPPESPESPEPPGAAGGVGAAGAAGAVGAASAAGAANVAGPNGDGPSPVTSAGNGTGGHAVASPPSIADQHTNGAAAEPSRDEDTVAIAIPAAAVAAAAAAGAVIGEPAHAASGAGIAPAAIAAAGAVPAVHGAPELAADIAAATPAQTADGSLAVDSPRAVARRRRRRAAPIALLALALGGLAAVLLGIGLLSGFGDRTGLPGASPTDDLTAIGVAPTPTPTPTPSPSPTLLLCRCRRPARPIRPLRRPLRRPPRHRHQRRRLVPPRRRLLAPHRVRLLGRLHGRHPVRRLPPHVPSRQRPAVIPLKPSFGSTRSSSSIDSAKRLRSGQPG